MDLDGSADCLYFYFSSWIQAFGEDGMMCLLKLLKDACNKNGQVEKKIQHECARCLKAFMNNKVRNSE